MAEHEFLRHGGIDILDLREVIDMTATGELEWGQDAMFSIGTNVERSIGEDNARARNLLEVHVGHAPGRYSDELRYVRMRDAQGKPYYVERNDDMGRVFIARKVLSVARIAVATENGRLSGSMEPCETCQRATGHMTLYDAAHGIPGAVMAGSERTECACCGTATPLPHVSSDKV